MSVESTLGRPTGAVAFVQVAPPSVVMKTPTSVATYHVVSGVHGSRVIALTGASGRLSAPEPLTSTKVGMLARVSAHRQMWLVPNPETPTRMSSVLFGLTLMLVID